MKKTMTVLSMCPHLRSSKELLAMAKRPGVTCLGIACQASPNPHLIHQVLGKALLETINQYIKHEHFNLH